MNHVTEAMVAVLSAIGGIAMLRGVVGMAFNGARDEWAPLCMTVAGICFFILYCMGVK